MATQDEKIKWVEGSPFMVDGFRFQKPECKHYLLTHFHSDHTTGLYKSFSAGTIYTSHGTAKLVVELLGVNQERVVALEMDKPHMVAGFELTLIDANHCPGAVMFVIRDPRQGGRISLHTGDFRADKSVCTNPVVKSLKGKVDSLYLDTTYCGPRHTFPDQHEVLEQAAHLVRLELQRDPSTLFLIGTYSIGKERVLEAVAKALGSRCLVSSRKARTMRLSGAWDDSSYTTHDASTGGGVVDGDTGAAWYAPVRAVPLQDTNSPATLLGVLAEARAGGAPFTSVVGVRPTGWTHMNARKGAWDKAGGVQSSIAVMPAGGGGAGQKGNAGNASGVGPGRSSSSSACDSDGGREPVPPPDGEDQDDEAAAWGAGGAFEDDGVGEREEAAKMDNGVVARLSLSLSSSSSSPWGGKKPWIDGNARVYSLPYSEHSSFNQLKDFVRAVRPKKIVPTVNAASPASVEKMLGHFLEFMDLSSDRKRLESYFFKPITAAAANASSRDVFSPAGAEAPKTVFGTSAEKRRKSSKCATPGSAHFSRSIWRHTGENSLALGMTATSRGNCQRPTTREGEGKTSRHGVVTENPPTAAGGGIIAVSAAASAARTVNLSGDDNVVDVHLGDVDVEAQKAIMAEIERRKAENRRGTGCERLDQTPGSARRGVETPGGALPTPRAGKGKFGNAPGSSAKRAAASRTDGRSGGWAIGGTAQAAKTAAVVAAPKPEGGGYGRQVFSVDDASAGTCSPMDIRDFFSKRR
eukprot:g6931.t1